MAVSSLFRLLFFLVFLFFIIFVDGQCLDDQKKLLLELKSELAFNASTSSSLASWNETVDSIEWDGVECDDSGHVISLDLYNEGISGGIGESSTLFKLRYLLELDLSLNDFTTTEIPNQFHRLTNLRRLYLTLSNFVGPIPSTVANLTELVEVQLSGNFLTGSIPSFHTCKNLKSINLADNNLIGSLSHLHFEALTNLTYLDLSFNSLNGTIPHHIFAMPSIATLFLNGNQFGGRIKELLVLNHSKMVHLDLSLNKLQGHIPSFFFQLKNLVDFCLSGNMLDGTFHLKNIQSIPNLRQLDLSYNNLSVETTINMSSDGFPRLSILRLASCNLYDFPNHGNLSYLSDLDLSNNHLRGDIPSWIWGIEMVFFNLSLNLLTNLQKPYHIPPSLRLLDLHSNQLCCEFPLLPRATPLDKVVPNQTYVLLANNSITGLIPSSICDTTPIAVLDLSFNNLSGSMPLCLVKNNTWLRVLNLRGNNIHGVIPNKFGECGLRTFDVSDNNIGGKIPNSLANCKELAVMNVGNNNIVDSFPCKALPVSLKILVLRSNGFRGDLTCHKSWPHLQILDISTNNFSGTLDPLNFLSWSGIMQQSHAHLRPNRSAFDILSTNSVYRDEVTLTVKGIEVKLVKIWPDFTSIDVSSNHFQGEIPDAIGNLSSLYLLNLSHNSLTHAIPKSLGVLTELGSLDLSANKLTGRIPEELAKLTFLSVLNVSYNHLTGMIPTGPQLQTFSEDSFEGNTGLCGFPLKRSCNSPLGLGPIPSEPKDEEIEWEYVFVVIGYVVGLGSMGWILLCHKSFRESYFEKIEEVADKIFYERGRRRRHERRIRIREEKKRNGLRRHHH